MERIALIFISVALASAHITHAQQTMTIGDAEIRASYHDFGMVENSVSDLEGVFHVKNIGKSKLTITRAVATCHCTDVEWTQNPIAVGDSGIVKFIYHKEPYIENFSKEINVYTDSSEEAMTLRFGGTFYESDASLSMNYPYTYGALGMSERPVGFPKTYKGESRTETVHIANLGPETIHLSVTKTDEGLEAEFLTPEISSHETGLLRLKVSPVDTQWGWQNLKATPAVNGAYTEPIVIQVLIVPDWRHASHDELINGPYPKLDNRRISLGNASAGETLNGSITLTNLSDQALSIYDVNSPEREFTSVHPNNIAANDSGRIILSLDTTGKEKGEYYTTVSLITNSPALPVADITVTYTIL